MQGLIDDVHVGIKNSIDDGLIGLEVTDIDKDNDEINTKVLNSGTLKNKKGVNVPGVSVNLTRYYGKRCERYYIRY